MHTIFPLPPQQVLELFFLKKKKLVISDDILNIYLKK